MNITALPTNPLLSVTSWTTLQEFMDESEQLNFNYRLQQRKRFAVFSGLFNHTYRVTWGHMIRFASSDDKSEIEEFFFSKKKESELNGILTQQIREKLIERENFATSKQTIVGWNATKYFVSSNWHLFVESTGRDYHVVKPVLYFTRRQPKFVNNKLTFGNKVLNELIFGVCDVLVDPVKHSEIEKTVMYLPDQPVEDSTLANFTFSEKNFRKFDKVAPSVEDDGKSSLLLFIHGYNADFTNPIHSMAAIGKGIDWKGTLCCYCWPSKDKKLGYYADKALIDTEEVQHLRKVLEILASGNQHFSKVTILAHSMGNHLLFETMALCSSIFNPKTKFLWNIVAAHANIPRKRFKEIVTDCQWMSTHWHAIGHASDLPLLFARITLQGSQLGIPNGEPLIITANGESTEVHYIDLTLHHKVRGFSVDAHSVFKKSCAVEFLKQILLFPESSGSLKSDPDDSLSLTMQSMNEDFEEKNELASPGGWDLYN